MMGFLWRMLGRARRPAGQAKPQGGAAPRRTVPLGEAFTPCQPKTGRRRQVGRQAELARILQLLTEDRAHVVLYSDRGRGKTSLSNMVVQELRRSGTVVARHTCEAGTTFDSMMRGLMRDLPAAMLTAAAIGGPQDGPQSGANDGCEAALGAGELRPRAVAALPQRLACRNLVCLIDEFDRVEDRTTRTLLADTIKLLSDRDAKLLFLIVGVSDNLGEILGQHPSIQRSVAGVHLPLLTDRDVAQLISAGGRETGFTFLPSATARIAVLARGMPYIAQLLGLRLTQAASARGDTTVSEDDFTSAVSRMLSDTQPRIVALYDALVEHGRDGEMVQTLRRVSTAPQDAWGRIQMTRLDLVVLAGGRPVPMQHWDRLVANGTLVATGSGGGLYAFGERLLMHYSLLLAAQDTVMRDTVMQDGSEPVEPPLSRTLHVVSQS